MPASLLGSLRILACLSIGLTLPATCLAQADAAESGVPEVAYDDLTVPEAFKKSAPSELADLLTMEQHVQQLSRKVVPCTVSIQVGRAQGSGVIVSPDGYVLTAAHVIGQPGRRCTIIFPDGTRKSGETLGVDTMIDAGLVKLNEQRTGGWPYAAMAESDPVEVGAWCIATGHPGGFNVDRQPVVRLGRVIFTSKRVLQSDCELVGGDSGGPLFDMRGRVIAVNSRIQDSTSANYHVPVRAYRDEWTRLAGGKEFASHSEPLLGVAGTAVTDGLKITRVYPGEAADFAGLLEGDILVTFQSKPVPSQSRLSEMVGQEEPGSSVRIEVLRDGEPMVLRVRLGMRWE
ncbi:MAG: trypsin-like peptidase domain-containing protein [Planctomycetaceae bacterium]